MDAQKAFSAPYAPRAQLCSHINSIYSESFSKWFSFIRSFVRSFSERFVSNVCIRHWGLNGEQNQHSLLGKTHIHGQTDRCRIRLWRKNEDVGGHVTGRDLS